MVDLVVLPKCGLHRNHSPMSQTKLGCTKELFPIQMAQKMGQEQKGSRRGHPTSLTFLPLPHFLRGSNVKKLFCLASMELLAMQPSPNPTNALSICKSKGANQLFCLVDCSIISTLEEPISILAYFEVLCGLSILTVRRSLVSCDSANNTHT